MNISARLENYPSIRPSFQQTGMLTILKRKTEQSKKTISNERDFQAS